MKQDRYAKEELDIHGVPFYIINNKYVLEGAESSNTFLSAFLKAIS